MHTYLNRPCRVEWEGWIFPSSPATYYPHWIQLLWWSCQMNSASYQHDFPPGLQIRETSFQWWCVSVCQQHNTHSHIQHFCLPSRSIQHREGKRSREIKWQVHTTINIHSSIRTRYHSSLNTRLNLPNHNAKIHRHLSCSFWLWSLWQRRNWHQDYKWEPFTVGKAAQPCLSKLGDFWTQ